MTRPLTLMLLLAAGAAAQEIPYERIRDAAKEPANWLTYSGTYNGQRHSGLAQINRRNVGRLKVAWVYQARGRAEKLEVTPIVIDGILYVTESPYVVSAIDGRTGRSVWTYRRKETTGVVGCCGPVNRGLAVLGDALYLGTYDNHLVCLDLRTGRERWDVTIADYKTGHSLTVAPLAVKDKIIVGISGGEFGIRGFLDAYDAKTGERSWRFWTIPGEGEPGNDTWEGDSWKTGGAPTWVTGAYDPDLNLIYWGTGNPSPDYNGDNREGDNLYSDSLVALDADTGKLRWYFQFTPHDLHDWDANQVPITFDAVVGGRMRKLIATANRNCFYYVLDRETGEYLSGTPFAKQTWASGLDERGRPIRLPDTKPTKDGTLVYPGLAGGTNWFSPAYSPLTKLFYVNVREDYAEVFFKRDEEYTPGGRWESGGTRSVEGQEPYGVTKAIEATTGKIRWEWKQHAPSGAGVLSTAGGLVFGGTREGHVFALDAETGKPLWRFLAGAGVDSNPITYAVDGKQQMAVASGGSIFAFDLMPSR
jgi:alcohol dehydrogenase (cytochrome c)